MLVLTLKYLVSAIGQAHARSLASNAAIFLTLLTRKLQEVGENSTKMSQSGRQNIEQQKRENGGESIYH